MNQNKAKTVTIKVLLEAYDEAYKISRWGNKKDEEEFLSKYSFLNFAKAKSEDDKCNAERLEKLFAERKEAFLNLTGESDPSDIPEEVLEKIYAQAKKDFKPYEHSLYFWDNIEDQIKNRINEIDTNKYYLYNEDGTLRGSGTVTRFEAEEYAKSCGFPINEGKGVAFVKEEK